MARAAPFLLLIATLLVFLPGLGADFVFDDRLLVLQNTATASLSDWPTWFTTDLWATTPGDTAETGFYRPLLLASLALDRAVAGLDPMVHHLDSLCWHLLATGLLLALLRRVVDPMAAAVGAAVFALHPVQVESVMFVSARNDPMAAALLFAAFLLVERDEPHPGALAVGALCTLAAALAKESVLVAPALLALLAWARTGRPGPWRAHTAVAVGLALALALRVWAEIGLPAGATPARVAAAVPAASALYASKLLVPVALSPAVNVYWPPEIPWSLLVAAVLVAVVLAVLGQRRSVAGLSFLVVALAPAFAGIARQGSVADRYLYLPLAGLALAVAAAVAPLPRPSQRSSLFVALLVAGGLGCTLQIPVWASDDALWTAVVARSPGPFAYGGLAKLRESEGRLDEAADLYRQAVEAPRPYAHSCFNITSIHLRRGDPASAVAEGQRALENGCEPSAELLAPLALAEALVGRWDAAELTAARVGHDPTGKAVLVTVAAAARRGDLGAFEAVAGSDPAGRSALADQVGEVLEQSGDARSAAAVRAAAGR